MAKFVTIWECVQCGFTWSDVKWSGPGRTLTRRYACVQCKAPVNVNKHDR